ncbi:Ig-like domain repeat protein [Streptomyces sp. NPDC004031]
MRRRSISTATALAVTFSSVALTVAVAGSAAAASAVVTSPGGIAVDGALQKVFVGDRSSGKIVATDYNGTVVDSVSGISGVSDLTLSDDGTVLYAASEGAHQIVALDAATLDVKTRYSVATNKGPRYVEFSAGKVWFTYGDQGNGNLGSVDPSVTAAAPASARSLTADPSEPPAADPTAEPTADPTQSATPEPTGTATAEPTEPPTPDPSDSPTPEPTQSATPEPSDTGAPEPTESASPEPTAPTTDPTPTPVDPVTLGQFPGIWGPGILDTNPSAPGVLVIGQTGISTDSMAVVDVSSGVPQRTAWYAGDYTLNSGIYDIDLVPGSSQVLVNGTQLDNYADGKFSAGSAYPGGQLADVAADGLVAQGSGTNVAVYRPNATKPLRTYAVGGSVGDLAWAPDSSRVFALVGSGSSYTLKPLTDPTKNVPTLTVSAPATATRAKPLTVTGKLSTTVPVAAGTKLQVVRTDMASPNGRGLVAATLKADGTYAFTDVPPVGGTVTYKVTYLGDAGHLAVSASRSVLVPRNATTLTLSNTGKTYNYHSTVTFTAHLGPTYRNRVVEIWDDPYGTDMGKKLLKSGTVNSHGDLSASLQLVRDTTFTVVYQGDALTSPHSVTAKAYTRVAVSTAISRQYKTGKIGSTTYYWFHKSTAPYATTSMTYYPGRSVRLDLEVYYAGKWYPESEYFRLSTSGKVTVDLGAPGQAGLKARIRSAYIDTQSGDSVNSTTYTSWRYLYFTK